MGIGERWQHWWDRLTHREAEDRDQTSRPPAEGAGARHGPESARALGQVPKGPDGELKLAVDPAKASVPQRRKVRSAGFDPYANDAGYEKPRNWDEVDPR